MSPRVRTPKVTPTVWRERLSANVNDRQTFWAMRGGHFLTVTVSRQDDGRLHVLGRVTGNGIGLARNLEAVHSKDTSSDEVSARVASLKRWAEILVDNHGTKTD